MYHITCIMNMPRVSQHCLFNCTYVYATNGMTKCVHPNTAVKT